MQNSIAPGPRKLRSRLFVVAWLVGATLCALAVLMAVWPLMMSSLCEDALVMRSLGVLMLVSSWMITLGGWKLALGIRRMAAVMIGLYLVVLGGWLLARPLDGAWFYRTGRAIVAPWILGVPGLMLLWLGRWDHGVRRGQMPQTKRLPSSD